MNYVRCATQAELDAVLARALPDEVAELVGNGWFAARGSAHVVAWESAHVVATQDEALRA